MIETDFPEALKRFGGDINLLIATAAMVAEDAPSQLQMLTTALHHKDVAQVRMSSHALKGMLSTFSQSTAVSGLQQVESAAASGDLAAAQTHLERVREEIVTQISQIAAAC